MTHKKLAELLKEVSRCQICAAYLPNPPRPVLVVSPKTRILIIGQAPGQKVHDRGIPREDKSGDVLRDWLGVTKAQFGNTNLIGTMPMGFCFPGRNNKDSGDVPPRSECAPQWHQRILEQMTDLRLTLIIGQYAMKAYFGTEQKRNLTETVRAYEDYLPTYFPLVHPSPSNF
jgi:uracil-DNA glycosylase